jgi:hypothetical protein
MAREATGQLVTGQKAGKAGLWQLSAGLPMVGPQSAHELR